MSFDLENFDKFKQELNKEKIYFGIYETNKFNFYICVNCKLQLNIESFVINDFCVTKYGEIVNNLKQYSYCITNENFNIREFIKTFDVDIRNTNVENFALFVKEKVYNLKLSLNRIESSIEDLNLEFM